MRAPRNLRREIMKAGVSIGPVHAFVSVHRPNDARKLFDMAFTVTVHNPSAKKRYDERIKQEITENDAKLKSEF